MRRGTSGAGPGPAGLRSVGLRALLAVGGAALLSGCVGPPPVAVEAQHGVVRAESLEQALEISRMLDRLYEDVQRTLPHTREARVDLWIQEHPQLVAFFPATPDVGGFAVRFLDRIHVRDEPLRLASYLAHELVHILLDDSWEALPPALEEGLAEHVSFRLVPDPFENDRPEKLLHALSAAGQEFWELCELRFARPASNGGVSVHLSSLVSDDPVVEPLRVFDSNRAKVAAFFGPADRSIWYSLGFLAVARLVTRHGYEGLHRLAVEAGEAAEDDARIQLFTRAADLTLDPATWRTAFLEEITEGDLRWYATVTADQWARVTAIVSRPIFPGMDVQEFLSTVRPTLGVRETPVEVPLHRMPAFRGKLREEWNVPERQPRLTSVPLKETLPKKRT